MSEYKTSKSKKSTILRVAILSTLFLFGSVAGMRVLLSMRKPAKRKAIPSRPLHVQTQVVKKQPTTLFLEGFGTTQALKQVSVVPEVSGKVTYVSPLLKVGARVKKGTLLVRIDSRVYGAEYSRLKGQYNSLKKQIKILKQALSLDRSNLSRNRRLLRSKAIDRGTYDQQKIRLLERQQRLESMEQNMHNLRGQLRKAAINLGRTRIRAPFDARVAKADVDLSAYVGPNRSIATLESRYTLEIPVSFPVSSLNQFKSKDGEPIDLEALPAYFKQLPPVQISQSNRPSTVWTGRVVRIGAKLDLSTRTIPLWIRIDLRSRVKKSRKYKYQPTILPGTFCQVRIPIRKEQDAVVVPRQAIYGEYTYLAINNRISRRKVKVSHTNKDSVVLTRGLNPGEKLIVSPLVDPLVGAQVTQTVRQ